MAEKNEKIKYFEGIGRRKTAVARVRFSPDADKDGFTVNGVDYKKYFTVARFRESASAPLKAVHGKSNVSVNVKGGGMMAQAEAVMLGLARALVKHNPDSRKEMRAFGYLTRDPRMVERKKYGLKKARRAPQWTKR